MFELNLFTAKKWLGQLLMPLPFSLSLLLLALALLVMAALIWFRLPETRAPVADAVRIERRRGDQLETIDYPAGVREQAGLKRLFLHAASLEFALDGGKTPYVLNAPLPQDLVEAMNRL